MARLAIRVKVVIFFGFVGYSLMIVDEFHLGLSRESELIAWVGVPIVLANLWLTGAQSRRFAMPTLTVWSAVLTGVFMVLVVIPRAMAHCGPR
jgi:hypothetical protein